MNFSVLFISIILVSYTPGRCQRRNPWRGARQGSRRHVCQEERVRGVRTPQVPNYNPMPNRVLPIATPCQKVDPPQVYQNLAKFPDVQNNLPASNVECAQNVVLLPNMQLVQTPQIVPNPQSMPVPNVQIEAQNLPNVQYMESAQLVPNVPSIPEPVPNALEVPVQPPRKMRLDIPFPSVEPPERYSCASPLVSPYLPAASPVSALFPPTSNLLPPITTSQSRSHFLRKIPIPPPTL